MKTLDVVWSRLVMIVNVVVIGLAKTLLLLFSEVNRSSRWTVQNPVYVKAGGGTDRPTRLQQVSHFVDKRFGSHFFHRQEAGRS